MQKSSSRPQTRPNKYVTRRDRFLAAISSVTSWGKRQALVEPFYPTVGGAGRQPIGMARVLRIGGIAVFW